MYSKTDNTRIESTVKLFSLFIKFETRVKGEKKNVQKLILASADTDMH